MTSKGFTLLTATSVLVSGCTATQRYHVPPAGIIDDVDEPSKVIYRDRKEGPSDARTISNAFLTAYARSYDASKPDSTDPRNADSKALEMTKLGMTVIEVRCDLFFGSIGRGSQKLEFARREVEIFTSVLTSVLGLTGASDDLVAATGLASGATLSTINNYQNVFFFSPEIGKVQRLVDDAMEKLRIAMLDATKAPRDYESAVRALKRYQSVCTAHEIKRLVNEAVDAGRVRIKFNDESTDPYNDATVTLFARMAKALKVDAVDITDTALLSWMFEEKPPSKQDLDLICLNFTTEKLRKFACKGSLGGRSATPELNALKVEVMKSIDALALLRPEWLKKEVDEWKAVAKNSREGFDQIRSEAQRNLANLSAEQQKAAALKTELDAIRLADDARKAKEAGNPTATREDQAQPVVTVKNPND